MRNVTLRVRVPAIDATTCFDRISDFARYPELVDVVRAVTVHPASDGPDRRESSDWEVYFRNGILRWSEVDVLDGERRVITFEQIDGDFEEFSGRWVIEPAPPPAAGGSPDGVPDGVPDGAAGQVVLFEAAFDFGIPSLAGILDPIAERVFKETIARVLAGLFGDVEVLGDPSVAAVLARVLTPTRSLETEVA